MPSETFQASRWTKGNFLFPIHIKTGLIWSDILIESSGGTDPLASHGHRKADARRIKELIEDFQAKPTGEEERGRQMTKSE